MKKLLYLLLFISGIASAQSPVNGSYGRFRDYVSSYTANSNLTTYGRGSGFVDVQDTLRLSGLSGSTFPYINVNKLVTGVSASTFMTNLGGTTIGQAVFTSTNPSAERFGIANADNTFTWATASDFRTAIGAGTGNGNVTKVGTPLDNQIGVWTGDGTIEGDPNFTWNGARLGVLATTEQLRLSYDASNYLSFTVSSTGQSTITQEGSSSGIIILNPDLSQNGYVKFEGPNEAALFGSFSGTYSYMQPGTFQTRNTGNAAITSYTTNSSGVASFNNTSPGYSFNINAVPQLIMNSSGDLDFEGNALSDLTLTAPKFATSGFIADANGVALIAFPATVASAARYLTIANSTTGGNPSITATGTNSGIDYVAVGTGTHRFTGAMSIGGALNAQLTHQVLSSGAATATYTAISNSDEGSYLGFYSGSSGDANSSLYWPSTAALTFGTATNINTAGFTTRMTLRANGNLMLTGTLNETGTRVSDIFTVDQHTTNAETVDSDSTLKEKVKQLPSQLAKIAQIKPVTHEWKDKIKKDSAVHYSVLAQEIREIYPEVVVSTLDSLGNETLGVRYQELIPPMIKAIQELQTQIAELQEEIVTLESKNK